MKSLHIPGSFRVYGYIYDPIPFFNQGLLTTVNECTHLLIYYELIDSIAGIPKALVRIKSDIYITTLSKIYENNCKNLID